MKLNKKNKLILISKYNLDLISQIVNNKKFKNHNIECSNFNGNLEIFLMNNNNIKKNDYAFIIEDIHDISEEFKKSLNNETINFKKFKNEIENYCKLINILKKKVSKIFISNFEIYERTNFLNFFTHSKKEKGPSYLINTANNLISDFFDNSEGIFLINNSHLSNIKINYSKLNYKFSI